MSDESAEQDDALRLLAARLIQDPDDATARSQFSQALDAINDPAQIQELADRLAPHIEVAVPLHQRLLQLAGGRDVPLVLKIGRISWLAGDDVIAAEQLRIAKDLEGETARVLELEAMLERDDARKKTLYARILALEPTNRGAFQHLVALRK